MPAALSHGFLVTPSATGLSAHCPHSTNALRGAAVVGHPSAVHATAPTDAPMSLTRQGLAQISASETRP